VERAVLFRRCMHCGLALGPVYYLLPEELPWLGVGRWVLLIGFISAVALFEVVRLLKGWTFFGLRPHERRQIASFVWASAGAVAALWFFRDDVASAAIIGMALVDPLAGELRRVRSSLWITVGLPVVTYATIAATVLVAFETMPHLYVVGASLFGAVTAVLAERWKVRYLDDDFLMIVVPCLLMGLFTL
jgi:hypothetical protein